MRQEAKRNIEDDLIASGWVKLEDGLFVDMSDTDDYYGRMLGHIFQNPHCELPHVDKIKTRNK